MLEIQCDAALRAAISAQFGVRIRVISIDTVVAPTLRAKQILYRFRREFGPDFRAVQIRLDPRDPDNRLWLINGNNIAAPEGAEEEEPAAPALPLSQLVDVDSL
jgi:hypothetical protein